MVELVIVIVVVGILAAIAFPSYDEYVKRARRGDGTETLLAAAQSLEVFRGRSATYTTDVGLANIETTSPDAYYDNLTISAGPCGDIGNCYTITIRPTNKNGQNQDEVKCFRLGSNGTREWHPTDSTCAAAAGWIEGW